MEKPVISGTDKSGQNRLRFICAFFNYNEKGGDFMNKFKRMIAVCAAVGMLCSTVYAQGTHDLGYRVKMNEEQVTVTEDDFVSDIDNSNLDVSVVKQQGDTRTTIFTGKLKDYDNGRWVYTDFSEIQFMVVMEWEGPEDELIYIIPKKETEIERSAQATVMSADVIQPSLNIVENFYINNSKITENYETQEIRGGDNLCANCSITNTGSAKQSVQLILCAYNMQGRLIGIISSEPYNLEAGETKNFEKSMTIDSSITNCYAKVMIWDGIGSLRPLHSSLEVGKNSVSHETAVATVNCVANKEYNLVTTIENMPQNDAGHYKIKYDPTKLELIDLCSLTYKKELQVGDIPGTSIKIVGLDIAKGEIIFESPNSGARNVSKVLNAVKFKALVSDVQTVITIE